MQIAVGYEHENLYQEALVLANELGLTLDNKAQDLLLVHCDGLALKIFPFLPIHANFSAAFWKKRRDEGRRQGLVKACQPKTSKRILDATAGWGRDAAILASFGAKVCMLERNPIMHALLRDALARQDPDSQKALQIELIQEDALHYLNTIAEKDYPDIIYIDPMHPARQKSALVKKDLQLLQQLIGPDRDAGRLIELAKTKALERVVVKWPQSLEALIKPDFSFPGKTVRFDVYNLDF